MWAGLSRTRALALAPADNERPVSGAARSQAAFKSLARSSSVVLEKSYLSVVADRRSRAAAHLLAPPRRARSFSYTRAGRLRQATTPAHVLLRVRGSRGRLTGARPSPPIARPGASWLPHRGDALVRGQSRPELGAGTLPRASTSRGLGMRRSLLSRRIGPALLAVRAVGRRRRAAADQDLDQQSQSQRLGHARQLGSQHGDALVDLPPALKRGLDR